MTQRWLVRNWPLGVQLAVAFTLIALLALGGGGALLVKRITDQQVTHRTAQVQTHARLAADLVMQHRFIQEPSVLPLALFSFHQQTGARSILIDPDGVVLADSWIPSPILSKTLTYPEVETALEGSEASGIRRFPEGDWVLLASAPLEGGRGAVLVVSDLTDLDASLADFKEQLLLVLSVAGGLVILSGFGVAWYLARPLLLLDRAAAELASGDLGARVQPAGSREVAALGHRFNLMASELARVDAQRRNFVAAASHELRTPLAAIRALAEALLVDQRNDIALYREYLDDIVTESERARQLMDRLLELTRLEGQGSLRTGEDLPRQERFDLRALSEEVVDSLVPLAHDRAIHLEVGATDPVWTKGDPWLVETVITNLVENALKYTPQGGRVDVTVEAAADAAMLHVRDTGPGIAPEHLPHLFERFYRVDQSRARATGGVGLGLAIAAEAARLLNGRLEVTSSPGRGSCFSLVLPPFDGN